MVTRLPAEMAPCLEHRARVEVDSAMAKQLTPALAAQLVLDAKNTMMAIRVARDGTAKERNKAYSANRRVLRDIQRALKAAAKRREAAEKLIGG